MAQKMTNQIVSLLFQNKLFCRDALRCFPIVLFLALLALLRERLGKYQEEARSISTTTIAVAIRVDAQKHRNGDAVTNAKAHGCAIHAVSDRCAKNYHSTKLVCLFIFLFRFLFRFFFDDKLANRAL